MKDFPGQGTEGALQLIDRNDDVVRCDTAAVGVGRVVLESQHLGALENLHAVVDQQVLQPLQAQQGVDAIRARIADAGRKPLGAENTLQFVHVVDLLIRESHALPAFPFRSDGLFAPLADAQKERILLKQSTFDVVLLDGLDDAVDAPTRHLPDFPGGVRSEPANQLMQFQFAVGSQKSGAAT